MNEHSRIKNVEDAMIQLNDEDIFLRLTNTEDSTVERKTAADYRDCRKTAVAFSNSLPVGDPGIIFVGVHDDGAPEEKNNLDSLQRKVSEEINRIYPPIYVQMKVMSKNGAEFLAVVVRGSEGRPHFAGPAYVRDGTQSVNASQDQFSRLIAERNSAAYELLKWRGKEISVWQPGAAGAPYNPSIGSSFSATVLDCNPFFVTLQTEPHNLPFSHTLGSLVLGFNHLRSCLEIRLKPF